MDDVVTTDVQQWGRAASEMFVPLHVSSPQVNDFRAFVKMRELDGICVAEVRASRQLVRRTPELVATAGRRCYMLCFQLSGSGRVRQDDREALLGAGDIAVYDMDRPYTLVFDDEFRCLAVMIPHQILDLPRPVIAQLTATRMDEDEGACRIVRSFLFELGENIDRLTGTTGARLARNTAELTSTVLHASISRNPLFSHPPENRRRELRRRILAYIDDNLPDPDLSPSAVAAANFISLRYLHDLFSEQGATVSAWIRARRLDRCRRDLRDPACRDLSVAAIAARSGFVSAPHFSRLFRSQFGESASSYRAGAIGS